MAGVFLELTMSLDGYIAGPDVGPDEPMGVGGESLHDWMFVGRTDEELQEYMDSQFADVGALIAGRRMADLGIGPWGDEPVYHAPVFVVTHRPAETIEKLGGTSYIFVTNGIEEALRRAREAAGSQDVRINGGADIARQYLAAGLVDEVRLHIAPMFLGGGTRLFDGESLRDVRLTPTTVSNAPLATYITYEVSRAG